MSKDLYFIKILNHALSQPEPRDALRQAFTEIRSLGQRPEYQRGYDQFLKFMSMVKTNVAADAQAIDPDLLRSSLDDWMRTTGLRAPMPAIVLDLDGEVIASLQVVGTGSLGTVGGLAPGSYRVGLETGRVLWQGELTKGDLLWRYAFPEEDLPLAAETDEVTGRISREIILLEGEVVLKVTPGRTKGRMEFFFNG